MTVVRQHDQIDALPHLWLLQPVDDTSQLCISSANSAQASLRADATVMRGQIGVGKPQDGHPGLVHGKQVLKEDLGNIRQACLVRLTGSRDRAKSLDDGFCLSDGMTGRNALGREANPSE